MHVTILGSGTAVPSRDRSSPSLIVWVQNEPVLLDLGPGTLRQMTRVGIRHETLRHIFLTHFHPDHTADLVHFLFATRNPVVLRQRATVIVAGAIGLNAFIGRLQNAWDDRLTVPSELMKVHEFDLKEYRITNTCPPKSCTKESRINKERGTKNQEPGTRNQEPGTRNKERLTKSA